MTWTAFRSSDVRDTPDTATADISSGLTPTGAPPVSGPSPAGSSGNATSTLLDDLIERTKQLTADVRQAREEVEHGYGTGNSQA